MSINIKLNVLMAQKNIGLNDLAERIELSPVNLSILKNNKAKAIRFTTLEALCRELGCQPGDILEYEPQNDQEE